VLDAGSSARGTGAIKTYRDPTMLTIRRLMWFDLQYAQVAPGPGHQSGDQGNIILEKPVAMDARDLDRVQTAVKKAGVKACVCFECRFASQFQVTRSVIDQGLLGHLHYGEIDYYHGIGPWYGQYRWNIRKTKAAVPLSAGNMHGRLFCAWGPRSKR
jgi:hypothetical protein